MKIIPIFLILLTLTISGFARDQVEWRPVTPDELKMEEPMVEPGADAEAIFWEVRLDDKKRKKLSYQHYVRVKIFNERGREKFSKFDIPFFKGKKVEDVAARVIKPDGSIINIGPQDIFEREIIKQRKVKIRAKSFAVPGIAPGVIVEYQYREIFKNDSANGERLYFQRDIPIQNVSYYVRPYKGMSLQFKPRNMDLQNVRKMNDGFYLATMSNVPAYKEEPRMPPDEETRRWVYLSYNSFGFNATWSRLGLGAGMFFSKATKPDKNIEQMARQITAGATTNEEKLSKLYDYVQNNIRNISFNSEGVNRKFENDDASDTFKNKMGYAADIDMLFSSLARSLNFNAFMVLAGNRDENFFDPNRDPVNLNYLHPACVAIPVDGKWRFFNPGTPYLPFGELIWFEEGVNALLVNETQQRWVRTPISDHELTQGKRTGKFELSEDGTLTGEITLEYAGNWAVDRRRAGINDSPEKRLEDYKEELNEWVSTGEFSDIKIKNFESPNEKLQYSYKVKIPDYAQKTGKRMFFMPGVFAFNSKPEFSSTNRTHPIYFRYPWSEVDEIEIKLPEGFGVENFSAPKNVVEQSNLGGSNYNIGFDKENNAVTYKREYFFGGGQRVLFPSKAYTPLKRLFDLFHTSDMHTLSLIKKEE